MSFTKLNFTESKVNKLKGNLLTACYTFTLEQCIAKFVVKGVCWKNKRILNVV